MYKDIKETNLSFLEIFFLLSMIFIAVVFLEDMMPNSEESQLIVWKIFITISPFAAWSYSVIIAHSINGFCRGANLQVLDKNLSSLNLKADYLAVLTTMYDAPMKQNRDTIRNLAIEANRSFSEGIVYVAGSKGNKAIDEFFNLQKVFRAHCPNNKILFKLYPQRGYYKRNGMHPGLEYLREVISSLKGQKSIFLLMDGDTSLTEGIFDKTVPYLLKRSLNIGALTVDNVASSTGGGIFYTLFNNLRYLNRSHQLRSQTTVLTGRFALMRGETLLDQNFIDLIAEDYINHWLFGKIKLLTADDKSSHYHFLLKGLRVVYLPETVVCQEQLPTNNDGRLFEEVRGVFSVASRLRGNMLRAGLRCVMLGPKKLGWGLWYTYLDQQIGFFRPLIGPISAFWLWTMFGDGVLPIYLTIAIGWRACYISYKKLNRKYYRKLNSIEMFRQFLLIPIEATFQFFYDFSNSILSIHRFWFLDVQFWSRVIGSVTEKLTLFNSFVRWSGFFAVISAVCTLTAFTTSAWG